MFSHYFSGSSCIRRFFFVVGFDNDDQQAKVDIALLRFGADNCCCWKSEWDCSCGTSPPFQVLHASHCCLHFCRACPFSFVVHII